MKQIRFCDNRNQNIRKYYTSGEYLDYINRSEATLNLPSFVDINNNQIINDFKFQQLKEKMKNLDEKQIVWDYVVSFEKEFCELHSLYSVNDFVNVIKPSLEKFFEKNNMDMENLEIFGALHRNTDNPHLHIGFFEKEKKFITKNGQERFNKKGALGGYNVKNFKEFGFNVEKYVDENILFKELREKRKALKEQFGSIEKDNVYLETVSWFARNKIRNFSFKNLKDSAKGKIVNLTNYVIENNKDLKEKYIEYKNQLFKVFKSKESKVERYNLDYDKLVKWYQAEDEDVNLRNLNSLLKVIKSDLNEDKFLNDILETLNDELIDSSKKKFRKKRRSINNKQNQFKNLNRLMTKNNKLNELENSSYKTDATKNPDYYKLKQKQNLRKLENIIERAIDKNISLALNMFERTKGIVFDDKERN